MSTNLDRTAESDDNVPLASMEARLKARREALQASLGREALRAKTMRENQLEQTTSDRQEGIDQRVTLRSRDLEARNIERHTNELRLVEQALERLSDGSYGNCTRCAQPISSKRLDAQPAAPLCIDCQLQTELEDTTGLSS